MIKNERFYFDKDLLSKSNKHDYILGIDEVGWGCIAGELVLGGALIHKSFFDLIESNDFVELIKDSKKVSDKKRIILLENLKDQSLIKTTVGVASVDFINSVPNLAEAYTLCIDQILNSFKTELNSSLILIDGNRDPKTKLIKNFNLIIKGDDKSLTIGIASNVAKQHRDDLMVQHSLKYPHYNFENNVGYGTEVHCKALKTFGLTQIHRKKACQSILNK